MKAHEESRSISKWPLNTLTGQGHKIHNSASHCLHKFQGPKFTKMNSNDLHIMENS